MPKQHVKLFEEFLIGEDELGDILGGAGGDAGGGDAGGGDDKKKEEKPDPIKKLQDEEKAKEKKAEDDHAEFMEKKIAEIEKIFDQYPDIKEEIGKETIDALKSENRSKIHVAFNNLMYLQVKYEKAGSTDKVQQISKIKDVVDDLDRSFSTKKSM